jgi:hypothetical protein
VDVVVRSDGTVSEHPGGSPLNVAIGLARLERETHLLTRLGHEKDSRAYWIYEVYRDEQAFRAHLVAPYGGAVQRRADRPDRGGRLRPDVSDRAPMSWHSTATRTALSEVGRA